MTCPNCPTVPVVSERLVRQLVATWLDPGTRRIALGYSLEWLTTRHEGIEIYAGITSRMYTGEEQMAIGLETGIAAGLPCPFMSHVLNVCLIGGLGPHYNRVAEANSAPYGWLPALLARLLDRDLYHALAKSCQIASVKHALLSRNEAFTSRSPVTGKIVVG